MPKYAVQIEHTTAVTVFVEAENDAAAVAAGRHIDEHELQNADFTPTGEPFVNPVAIDEWPTDSEDDTDYWGLDGDWHEMHPTVPLYVGSNSDRQSVGLPGHCEQCANVGHVEAHPELGCSDVGCHASHDG